MSELRATRCHKDSIYLINRGGLLILFYEKKFISVLTFFKCMRDENHIHYKDGYVHITCKKCGKEYMVLTNGKHLLPDDASHKEKERWEFNLSCSFGYKNYRYE